MKNITKEALVEELRNKMWGIEGDVRLNNREPDADLMIERFLHHLTTALDCYGTAQRAEGAREAREEREQLLLSVNIPALVKKMKEEIQEHGEMHGQECAVNCEDPDWCNCEEMEFWGGKIAHYMAQVNDWWATHAQEHRKHCTPEGNKMLTRMMGKKNRPRHTIR